jgi:hypothetical protein
MSNREYEPEWPRSEAEAPAETRVPVWPREGEYQPYGLTLGDGIRRGPRSAYSPFYVRPGYRGDAGLRLVREVAHE